MATRAKWAWAAGAAVVIAVGFFAWPRYQFLKTLKLAEDRCPGHERFDAAVWHDTMQVNSPLAPRGCMVDDLLTRQLLVGHTAAEVTALLGPPERTEYFRDYDLVYWLGPERGWMSIDSEWLVMKVDSEQRVTAAKLVTD